MLHRDAACYARTWTWYIRAVSAPFSLERVESLFSWSHWLPFWSAQGFSKLRLDFLCSQREMPHAKGNVQGPGTWTSRDGGAHSHVGQGCGTGPAAAALSPPLLAAWAPFPVYPRKAKWFLVMKRIWTHSERCSAPWKLPILGACRILGSSEEENIYLRRFLVHRGVTE